jgi:uncharacterized protein (DUF302 family)
MTEPATISFIVPDSFEGAIKLIRQALTECGLNILVELDLSGRINQELGIALAACRVLCVDSPLFLLEALSLDGAAAVFLPAHVVVSEQRMQTVVHLLSPASIQSGGLPVSAKIPVSKLQEQLSRALEHIAMRQVSWQSSACSVR